MPLRRDRIQIAGKVHQALINAIAACAASRAVRHRTARRSSLGSVCIGGAAPLISSFVKPSGFRSDFCKTCGAPVPNLLRKTSIYWVPAGTCSRTASMRESMCICSSVRVRRGTPSSCPECSSKRCPGWPNWSRCSTPQPTAESYWPSRRRASASSGSYKTVPVPTPAPTRALPTGTPTPTPAPPTT